MNGLFNMNFMMTFLLAKDLPENNDKMVMALAGGQSRSLLTPVLLKVGAIDKITELTKENTGLKTEVSALQEVRADLADCQKISPKINEILAIMRKVRAKRTLQGFKDDSALLEEIYTLAGEIGPTPA